MFHINERDAPVKENACGKRGQSIQLVNQQVGSESIDFHINIIRPNTGLGPYHYHSNSDNLYFVLEGQAQVMVEGQEVVAGPGEAVWIPRGEKHDVVNIGTGDLRLIEVKTPADSDFIILNHPKDGRRYEL